MNEPTYGTDAAYPVSTIDNHTVYGLTKREAFAMAALTGTLANPTYSGVIVDAVRDAVVHADALIEALNKPE